MSRSIAEIQQDLRKHLTKERFDHSLRVADTARALAIRWGGDEETCYLAGLCHDAGKWKDSKAVIPACEARGIPLSPEDYLCPQVVHAYLSCAITRETYGICQEEVLKAVAHHCLGAPDMGLTETILFVADMIEPGRMGDWADSIRDLAQKDLDLAALACFEATIAYNQAKGNHIHEATWSNQKSLEDKINGRKGKSAADRAIYGG